MFEYFEFIVFQLVERIGLKELAKEFSGMENGYRNVVFRAFPCSAILSRHEATRKPYPREEKSTRLCGFKNNL